MKSFPLARSRASANRKGSRLQRVALLTAITTLLNPMQAVSQQATSAPPNIVLILADDMGFSDIGPYGSEINTPNLDRLARDGIRFRQFYNASRCCPTRASLLTGLYPHQAGIGGMVENLGRPGYIGHLNENCATIAEILRLQGYRTYLSGKWHVGEQKPNWPTDRGFDHAFSLISGATDYFAPEPGRQWTLDGSPYQPGKDPMYLTDTITDYARKYVREAADAKQPFFLYVAYNAPHWPLHARDEDIARYLGKYRKGWDSLREERHARQLELGVVDKKWTLSPRDAEVEPWNDFKDQAEYERRMAVYAAQVDRMDQGIGALLAQLEASGVSDNTVVFFLSDNGGCHEVIDRSRRPRPTDDPNALTGTPGSYRSYGRGWANASNTPFRLFKHWVHEGGIATPLIVYWPGKLHQPGVWTDQVGHVADLMPTCLEIAGATYPATRGDKPLTPLEGKSLVPLLRAGTPISRNPLFWEHEGSKAMRDGRWKLVCPPEGSWELYDMEADRTETHNLAAEHPEIVEAMQSKWQTWADRVGVIEHITPGTSR